jgi:hypothetical protein
MGKLVASRVTTIECRGKNQENGKRREKKVFIVAARRIA